MSNSSLMSIGEMIDNAFGDADVNIVNFKLMQAVLYLLARQLRILERRVKVEIEIDRRSPSANLSVTEVKIRATVPKKKRRPQKPSDVTRGDKEDARDGKPAVKSSKSKPLATDRYASEKFSEKPSSKSTEQSTFQKSFTTKTSPQISSSEKTSADKSSSEKTSSKKTSTEKTSTEKTSIDKTSTEKTSTDKTSTDKTSSDKTSSEKTSSQKTSPEKTASEKTSSEKTKSSTDKYSTDKTTSSSKKSTSKDASAKTSSDENKNQDLHNLLEQIEEQREKELRIIHQRADSRDVAEKSPTPMASLDSVEEQYEKLLVVERIPAGETRSTIDNKRVPQLNIVTQNQFEALAANVRELQSRFAAIPKPDFPDNTQLMQDLRKGASLTDAMAALQLSARLDAAERTLKQMLELVTNVAVKSGIEIDLEPKGVFDTNILPETSKSSTPLKSRTSKKSIVAKPSNLIQSSVSKSAQPLAESEPISEPSKTDTMPIPSFTTPKPEEEKLVAPIDCITYDDLDQAIAAVTNGILTTMTDITSKSNANAANAVKIAKKLEEKLESSLNLGSRMNNLELIVSEYSEQINLLDTSLSSQMTNYQEQLTQMQHDLEAGLEAMAEALANIGGDTAGVAELNTHFTNLQTDFDNASVLQKELKESQNGLSLDLQALWQQLELLRETKSDRDEVADALRDKAGIGALNGLVSLQQFHAVRGDFEKRIGAAYDKFNNQEIIWQKAIDDLLKELSDKADWVQLVALRDDINKNLEILRNRTHAMLEIVGEPRSATIARKLFRDAACLSCSSPAHMDLEEPEMIPQLPAFPNSPTRPPTIGAEDNNKPKEDGDHRICYPGLSIPHPRDPRSHLCQRYCGGSHTVVTEKKTRAPVGIIITPAMRRTTTGIGSDGKIYMMDDLKPVKKPCLPCNAKDINAPQPSEAEPAPTQADDNSDMTPFDFFSPILHSAAEPKDDIPTPPPPIEEF